MRLCSLFVTSGDAVVDAASTPGAEEWGGAGATLRRCPFPRTPGLGDQEGATQGREGSV